MQMSVCESYVRCIWVCMCQASPGRRHNTRPCAAPTKHSYPVHVACSSIHLVTQMQQGCLYKLPRQYHLSKTDSARNSSTTPRQAAGPAVKEWWSHSSLACPHCRQQHPSAPTLPPPPPKQHPCPPLPVTTPFSPTPHSSTGPSPVSCCHQPSPAVHHACAHQPRQAR
jgi:hypothetical protein